MGSACAGGNGLSPVGDLGGMRGREIVDLAEEFDEERAEILAEN
jgi:hypothetical protein